MDAKVNLNADGSMRIENEITVDGVSFLTTITLSNIITVTVERQTEGLMLFDEIAKSDSWVFQTGEYAEALMWAANRRADLRMEVSRQTVS